MGQAQPAPVYEEPEFQTDLPVGEVLRRARLHYGQSLKDVEKNVRIRASQIEAIETGNYENLPGRVYAIGFVRSYAEYLGLDGGQVVSLFKAQSMGTTANPELHFPAPASESKLPSKWVITGCIAATMLLTMLWWAQVEKSREAVQNIPPVSAELKAKVGIKEEVPVTPAVAIASEQPPSGAALEAPSEPVATVPQAEEAEDVTPVSAPPVENGITLNITENSWVEIRDASDQIIVSKVLKVGDQYFVPNRPDLKMALGNAGGVEITVDGKALPPLGGRGQVRRDISLDADALRASLNTSLEKPAQ